MCVLGGLGGGGGLDDRQVTVISTENKSITTQTDKSIKAKTHCKEEREKKVLFGNTTILRVEGQMKTADISEPYTRNWNSSIQQGM